MRLYLSRALLLGVFLAFYIGSYSALQDQHKQTSSGQGQTTSLWEMPPDFLRALAGEFKGLVADIIVLDVGAQLGTELTSTPEGWTRVVEKKQDWKAIHRLFVNSQALDPSFQHTYILAQGWLPWDAHMLGETQDILRTAAENRPWDWQPLHFMGFNSYYFLNQPGEAGKLFLEAAHTPYAPPFLAILGARLAQKGGETQTAIALMKSMLIGKNETEPGYNDIADRLEALEGVLILEQAVARYHNTTGKIPGTPEELVSSRTIGALPGNPYNISYCIDAAGTVYFDNPGCRTANGSEEP